MRARPSSLGQTLFSLRDRSARYFAVESAEPGVVRMTHDACRTPHILRRMQYAELVLNCVRLQYHSPKRESRGNKFIVMMK